MTRNIMIVGALVTALAATAPLTAQMKSGDQMKSGEMKMSKSEMAAMNKCKAMSHDAMMKNKKCAAMMKKESDMMAHGK